jgi:uncharacterized protein
MSRHLMLVPTLACPASCTYCFGPHMGGLSMRRETVEAVAHWQKLLDVGEESLEITFHGGEPLVPGVGFYRMALPLLRNALAPRDTRFGVQSNLWLLTDDLCDLFGQYDVSLGTSLDGPEHINDAQRGPGYFRSTMSGIERARAHGLDVGCICTFTAHSAPRADEVFDFFLREGLGFSVHAALPPLGRSGDGWALSPEAHGQLLVDLLERYLAHADEIRISTLDAMSRSVSAGRGGICTFGDCLGEYLAVDPQGWIYSCQRFVGMPEYRLGNVHDGPTMEDLSHTRIWRMFQARQEHIAQECGDCPHLNLCRGGCPYNVLAANGGSFDHTLRDPHCPAYRRAFSAITDRALEEVFSEENLTAVVEEGPGKYGLLRHGRLLQIMRGGPHPQKVAARARELVAAVALAVGDSPADALQKLDRAGLIARPEAALGSLTALRQRLDTQSQEGLVNAYIHVTYDCSLHCTHCYASSGSGLIASVMAVDDVTRLVREAAEAGFRKAVVTGGEPLMHPQSDVLLDALAGLREEIKPLQTVLRTNLAYPLPPTLLQRLASSTDQVVVSVDGDEASHDVRRGAGTYARTVTNLRALLATEPGTAVGLTAVLTAEQVDGPQGDAVRALGEELGVRVRFKSVLPLGRGAELSLTPAFYSSLDDDSERVACGARPASTCGLGMNLYVAPHGICTPCYALMGARHRLGNALDEGLAAVLERNDAYRQVTVDSNRKCRACALRYVCGGFCRAWSGDDDPDAPLRDCRALYAAAYARLLSTLDVLNVGVERWEAAGLSLPTPPLWIRQDHSDRR